MNILLSKKYFYVRNDPLSILESLNDYNMCTIAERVLNQIYPY